MFSTYRDYTIRETDVGTCVVYKDGELVARAVDYKAAKSIIDLLIADAERAPLDDEEEGEPS